MGCLWPHHICTVNSNFNFNLSTVIHHIQILIMQDVYVLEKHNKAKDQIAFQSIPYIGYNIWHSRTCEVHSQLSAIYNAKARYSFFPLQI